MRLGIISSVKLDNNKKVSKLNTTHSSPNFYGVCVCSVRWPQSLIPFLLWGHLITQQCSMAQLAAQETVNFEVPGSSPGGAAIQYLPALVFAGIEN